MKLTRKKLKRLIREFTKIGDDFRIGTGFPEEGATPGGGGNRLHQIVGTNEYSSDPKDFIAIPVDMSVVAQMRALYGVLSESSKQGLYGFTPSYDDADEDTVRRLRDLYIQLINEFSDHTDDLGYSWFYHVVFHPNYIAKEEDMEKNLDIYQRVAGYTPDIGLLQEYELIMHICSGLL